MIDLAAARVWLRDRLPEREPIELDDAGALERAAACIRAFPERRGVLSFQGAQARRRDSERQAA